MNHYNLWECLPAKARADYIQFLQVFGALSGLFKDIEIGGSANKPYLYYRNHEQLFAKVFAVEDLTRSDSAFDAIATLADGRVGIGLKTWIHLRDITFQKVAEFNKLALTVIRPLIDDASLDEVICQKIIFLKKITLAIIPLR